jgi:galactokinase
MGTPLRLLASFEQLTRREPQQILAVPERAMWLAAEIVARPRYQVLVVDKNARFVFDLSSARRWQTLRQRPLPSYLRYLVGTVRLLQHQGYTLTGANVVLAGDEPSGIRYEDSLGMAWAVLVYTLHQHPYDAAQLSTLIEQVQREYLS